MTDTTHSKFTILLFTAVLAFGLAVAPFAGVIGGVDAQSSPGTGETYEGTLLVNETGEPLGEEIIIG